MMCRNTSAGDRLKNGIPDIRTKEGGRDVSILEVQDWSGEGLEFGGGIGREVDELEGWLGQPNRVKGIGKSNSPVDS